MPDHHNDDPRPEGRRRRQVADWGVGEEIFDRLPGPPLERRPTGHRIPRGGSADGRRTFVIDAAEVPEEEPAEEFASRDAALRAREAHDELWDREELWAGGEPFVDHDAGTAAEFAARAEAFDAAFGSTVVGGDDADRPRGAVARAGHANRSRDAVVRGGQPGRRTVKVGGRPAEFHGPPACARRRPPRTVAERVGPRPERLVAWAFVLGLLLILIAVATANAAVSV
jgi:hypothetical protein